MENIKKIIFILFFFFSNISLAKETWVLDKDLSTINFELPVFLAKNVTGSFKEIEGLIEINIDPNKNSKAILSVKIDSIEMNYKKYKKLLLSEIFFYKNQFPLALIDTRKFKYVREKEIKMDVELNIKGITHDIPVILEIIDLTDDLVQVKGKLNFSRTSFQIGIGNWSSTAILKDIAEINTNLFFFRN